MTPTLHELADFTGHTILFEDPDSDAWVILKPGNGFIESFYNQMAIVGHKCKTFSVAQFLSSEDALRGVCWWCKEEVPESITTIWRLHNFDSLAKIIESVAYIKHWRGDEDEPTE